MGNNSRATRMGKNSNRSPQEWLKLGLQALQLVKQDTTYQELPQDFYYIVVDSLDEAVSQASGDQRDSIVGLLKVALDSDWLPSWLSIVASSRKKGYEQGKLGELIKKYRWYLVAIVALYAAITLWLFYFTDAPQNVPFEYEVH